MSWFIEKLDQLLAGVWIAVFGLAASQITPFATQYMARSAADLGRADARLADVQSGLRYQTMAEPVRAELTAEAKQKRAQAQAAHDALADTTPLLHPYSIWRSADEAIRSATWAAFVPALPTTAWSVVFTVLGVVIGFAAYELVKWPVVTILRAPRRRFKKRGGLI